MVWGFRGLGFGDEGSWWFMVRGLGLWGRGVLGLGLWSWVFRVWGLGVSGFRSGGSRDGKFW